MSGEIEVKGQPIPGCRFYGKTTFRHADGSETVYRFEDPPVVEGGQGRTPDSLRSDLRAWWLVVIVAVIFAAGFGLGRLI